MAQYLPDFDDIDIKLTSKIFSILENNFLFGKQQAVVNKGKVRVLSIDAAGLTDGILAAKSLCLLESLIRQKSGNPDSRIADYFDLAAGPGAGGILAALLFSRGPDGMPLSTADDALQFLLSRKKKASSALRIFSFKSKSNKTLKKKFGELSLKDLLKAVLIPSYDLTTRAPFVFSRADAVESDAFDFKLSHVCTATSSGRVSQTRSVDKKTKIVSAGGLAVNNNPTAVAITHVLNNKQEFPLCQGVEDLLVLSLGNGSLGGGGGQLMSLSASELAAAIACQGTSDLVDEAVSMAFGECRSTNYVRIQANCAVFPNNGNRAEIINFVDNMLKQKNAESVLFKGTKLVHNTNAEKLDFFAGELIKEHQRRKSDTLPTVLLKHVHVPSPRTSSATTLSTFSSN